MGALLLPGKGQGDLGSIKGSLKESIQTYAGDGPEIVDSSENNSSSIVNKVFPYSPREDHVFQTSRSESIISDTCHRPDTTRSSLNRSYDRGINDVYVNYYMAGDIMYVCMMSYDGMLIDVNDEAVANPVEKALLAML